MIVKKRTVIYEDSNLNIIGATLLSAQEARAMLTRLERKYGEQWWWLRSPGNYLTLVASVYRDGLVNITNVFNATCCIRPALIIENIESSGFQVGDIFKVGRWEFKVISNNLAWMYNQDIGYHRFDEMSNDYEKSEIKKFIDEWFNNLKEEVSD